MKITVIGSGYVGLVTGACLAELGNQVCCFDVNQEKIDLLNTGGVPIYEPGLKELISGARDSDRLYFTSNPADAVVFGDVLFIAVGTPSDESGSSNLKSRNQFVGLRGAFGEVVVGRNDSILKQFGFVRPYIQASKWRISEPWHIYYTK